MQTPSTSKDSNSVDKDYYLTLSKRNKPVLVCGGREFYKKRSNKDNSIIWRCAKAPSCFGTIKTLDRVIVKRGEHNIRCQPNSNKLFIKQSMQNIKEKMKSSDGRPVQQIYEDEVLLIKEKGLDLLEEIPKFSNVKTAFYDARNKSQNVSKLVFKNKSEVEIPKTFEDFLLFDYEDNDNRIIAFATKEARVKMAELTLFFGDGTFKCCINPFMQLYVIHGDMGSTETTTSVIPLVYCLLLNKNKTTYLTVFRLILSQIPMWKPSEFLTDFEPAAFEAMKIVFPEAKTRACYFHFCQALYKKGKQLNLIKKKNLKRHVALMLTLPLIPIEMVDDAFLYIMEDSPTNENVVKFNDYVVQTYMFGGKYPPTLWSAHNCRHRTTNTLESWHATLNRFVAKKKKLNMLQFLSILYKDAQIQNIRFTGQTSSSRPRRSDVLEREKRIESVLKDFSCGKINIGHCLEKLVP